SHSRHAMDGTVYIILIWQSVASWSHPNAWIAANDAGAGEPFSGRIGPHGEAAGVTQEQDE
ncbi:MAG: hypothetical protein ACUVQK_16005, partial [Thermogutta sp.]